MTFLGGFAPQTPQFLLNSCVRLSVPNLNWNYFLMLWQVERLSTQRQRQRKQSVDNSVHVQNKDKRSTSCAGWQIKSRRPSSSPIAPFSFVFRLRLCPVSLYVWRITMPPSTVKTTPFTEKRDRISHQCGIRGSSSNSLYELEGRQRARVPWATSSGSP